MRYLDNYGPLSLHNPQGEKPKGMGRQEKGNAKDFLPQADPPRKKTLETQDMNLSLGSAKKASERWLTRKCSIGMVVFLKTGSPKQEVEAEETFAVTFLNYNAFLEALWVTASGLLNWALSSDDTTNMKCVLEAKHTQRHLWAETKPQALEKLGHKVWRRHS